MPANGCLREAPNAGKLADMTAQSRRPLTLTAPETAPSFPSPDPAARRAPPSTPRGRRWASGRGCGRVRSARHRPPADASPMAPGSSSAPRHGRHWPPGVCGPTGPRPRPRPRREAPGREWRPERTCDVCLQVYPPEVDWCWIAESGRITGRPWRQVRNSASTP